MHLPNKSRPATRAPFIPARTGSGLLPSDLCVGASVNSQGQVCINTPLGGLCIPLSTPLPPGTNVQACVDVCTKFGIPTGACGVVTFNGQQLGRDCIGFC